MGVVGQAESSDLNFEKKESTYNINTFSCFVKLASHGTALTRKPGQVFVVPMPPSAI